MGAFPGMLNQMRIRVFDKSGTITTGGTAQLIMPKAYSRSSLIVQNISDTNMFIEFGGARATATLTNGSITSFSITNAGFGYTRAPKVVLYGGGNTGNNLNNSSFLGAALPDYPAPANIASATCVMTGSAGNLSVASITIDNPGSGYAIAPYVYLANDPLDPYGAASPSASNGIELLPQGQVTFDGPVCTTDQVSIFCASTGKAFTAKFTD
jgi:hypothetical protein